jgi:hypothetical protein
MRVQSPNGALPLLVEGFSAAVSEFHIPRIGEIRKVGKILFFDGVR